MKFALHCGSFPELSISQETDLTTRVGFHGLEVRASKLSRDDISEFFPPRDVSIAMIDVILGVERYPEMELPLPFLKRLLIEGNCNLLQVVVMNGYAQIPWKEQRTRLAATLSELWTEIAISDLRFGLELATFGTCNSIARGMDLLSLVGRERVGLVLDTWHLWRAGIEPEELRGLSSRDVSFVQLSDSSVTLNFEARDTDRREMPGEGLVPVNSFVKELQRIGYDSWACVEVFNSPLPTEARATTCLHLLERFWERKS